MLRDTTIDNNWWYTERQAIYNIRSINSSNEIIHLTRICAPLVGGNTKFHQKIDITQNRYYPG